MAEKFPKGFFEMDLTNPAQIVPCVFSQDFRCSGANAVKVSIIHERSNEYRGHQTVGLDERYPLQ